MSYPIVIPFLTASIFAAPPTQPKAAPLSLVSADAFAVHHDCHLSPLRILLKFLVDPHTASTLSLSPLRSILHNPPLP